MRSEFVTQNPASNSFLCDRVVGVMSGPISRGELWSLGFFWIVLFQGVSLRADEPIRFSREILPILSDNCFHCHGPSESGRKGNLRLDTETGAKDGDSPTIIPGKPDESELIRRLLSTDDSERMPPANSGRHVSPEQIQKIQRWIAEGASWGRHWAFEPVTRPPIPPLPPGARQTTNPIDAFVKSRLAREGLHLAPRASKPALIRRVTLDLTGLGPTPDDVAAFLADTSDNAFEKVVDRLLASPQYGERMVWDWLEAARYADTNGYQGDPTRGMYHWRDQVIAALNRNQPFDQFTIEQIAGDLLPNPTRDQLVATGFHRNHMINGEGGRIAEESRVDYVQDRVETTGTVWLGLTLNCCRCHDHKYDPLLQREYYQMYSYFNSIDESGANDANGYANPGMPLLSPEQEQQLTALKAAEQTSDQARNSYEQSLRESLPAWEETVLQNQKLLKWESLSPFQVASKNQSKLEIREEGAVLATGENPDVDEYLLQFRGVEHPITGIRLEVLPDDSLINKGPGRADNGNFVLSELEVLSSNGPCGLNALYADFSQQGWAVAGAVDRKPETGWAVMPAFGQRHEAIFEIRPEEPALGSSDWSVRLSFQFGRQHTLGKFRISATTSPREFLRVIPADVLALLNKKREERSPEENQKVFAFRRDQDPQAAELKRVFDAKRGEREGFERSLPRTMVMRERAQPRDSFILIRGAYDKFGDKVQPGVPGILPPLAPDAPPNRLSLARWLISQDHPLTARVTVNRYWQSLFGSGLVKTVEDFGVQGDPPTHPDLLDFLATEFMSPSVSQPSVDHGDGRNQWNVKHIHRLIVTSETYQQASQVPPELADRDPQNRLLARGPRYRLPSWMIRDQALAASGLLVPKLGGPPVAGYQPAGVWEEASFGQIRYTQDHGDALYRRSLYQFWRRIVGPTMFFDVATRQTCQVKLSRTNTPLQALLVLNDISYVEAARALAERALTASETVEGRLESIYQRLLARSPSAREVQVLKETVGTIHQQYAADPDAVKKLLAVGERPVNPTLDPVDQATYTALCNIVLNLDETLNKE